MDAPILNVRLPASVIQAGFSKGFRRNSDDVLLLGIFRLELRLNSVFPFTLHDLLDASLAQAVPLPSQPRLADSLEGLVNEDAAAETA